MEPLAGAGPNEMPGGAWTGSWPRSLLLGFAFFDVRSSAAAARPALACPFPPELEVTSVTTHTPIPARIRRTTSLGTHLIGVRLRLPPIRGLGLFIGRGIQGSQHADRDQREHDE